jgi:glutamine synthetase
MSIKTFEQVHAMGSESGVEFIDLKVLDLTGRLHHITFPFDRFTLTSMKEGIGFDGSSYGFLKVESSDMVIIPDLDTAYIDPFRTRPTISMFTHIQHADDSRKPFAQDGRSIVRAAEQALRDNDVAHTSYWIPEYEFNIFEEAEYESGVTAAGYQIQSQERFFQNAYHACNPHDKHDDFRDEACALMKKFDIPVRYHHHEVGEKAQQEIEGWIADLPSMTDQAVLTKYILFNLAEQHGLKLTFMPKPIYEEAGNGWHLHQFLVNEDGKNIFDDSEGYASLSQTALYYIGGILKHSAALCAFTNPSTNSYKRLVPGYEAPTVVTFGRSNRGAAIRIPSYVLDPQERRVEYRPPDFTCNPYFAASAVLMAGLDGIINKIDPMSQGYAPEDAPSAVAREEAKFLPRSLADALDALEEDNNFLTRDGVFPDALIRRWLEIKRAEISAIIKRPHPYEFSMYFDL